VQILIGVSRLLQSSIQAIVLIQAKKNVHHEAKTKREKNETQNENLAITFLRNIIR